MSSETGASSLALKAAKLVAVVGLLWHLYVLTIQPTSPGILRPVHILFLVIMAALTLSRPGRDRLGRLYQGIDWVLAGMVIASTIYIIYDQVDWSFRSGLTPTTLDLIFSAATTLAILELTRRLFGWPLVVLNLTFICYAALGWYAPSIFKIFPFGYERILGQIYSVENGVFGMMTGVSATYILPFMLLGRVMQASGTGGLFIDLANSLTGKSRGGPAKVAVVSSALFGTISGAGAANVVATGTFTIPLMKDAGYPGRFAAAVEAVASTGGQIMPPIMASAAFLAAELTGIPYGTIALAAIIPAILYYLALYAAIDLEAGKLGLATIAPEKIPSLKNLFLRQGYLLLPLFTIIFMLMVQNASPLRAAMVAIVVGIVVSWLRPESRVNLPKLIEAMYGAAKDLFPIGIAFAAAGIVVGMINLTGLGIKLTSLLMSFTQGQVVLALLMTMVVTIILGMGLPVAASYIIAASVCAPALIKMGVPTLPAHLFILHFASLSAITPPVALCAYAAAGIAKENPLKVGLTACRIGLVAFIVPYMFVMGPGLLLQSGAWLAVRTGITAVIGTLSVVVAAEGWWRKTVSWPCRALFLAGGVLLIEPHVLTDLIGVALMAAGFALHFLVGRGSAGLHQGKKAD
ncbi:MAG: TRAP transporter permease [Desulfocucumaceae bacterium]